MEEEFECTNGYIQVVAALIWQGDKFLICQRPQNKKRGLMWEFVGGKVEKGETMQEALKRECLEELGIKIGISGIYTQLFHEYTDIKIMLTLFSAYIESGEITLYEHKDARFIDVSQIDDFEFCPADEEILKKLKGENK